MAGKRISDICECDGKTIAQADETYNGGIIIRFTDGTWIGVEATSECDCYEAGAELHYFKPVKPVDLWYVGLIDVAERDTLEKAEKDTEVEKTRQRIAALKASIGE